MIQKKTAQKPYHSSPDFRRAFWLWAKIGVLSFGGPAAQIALIHREIVHEREWLSERQFLNALSFCMLLPGPEAMQLATYAGWRLHGVRGGITAGLLFVLPGALVILALAGLYAAFSDIEWVTAFFLGIKAAVIVIVIEALVRVANRALKRRTHWIIAALAFLSIFFLALPYPAIIAAAAFYGFFNVRLKGTSEKNIKQQALPSEISFKRSLRSASFWLILWLVPLALLPENILGDLGLFFSKLAVVTFGGAYAVLAYMAQEVVQQFGWLSAEQMTDALGLAETTPGPLILVTEFVGYMAAYKQGGVGLGILGALVTLWVTFVPCFLWIFVCAPYVDWISAQPRLEGALSAIMAAVVGVILNLTIWFALHVFFAEVTLKKTGILHLWQPSLATLDWKPSALAVLCAVFLFIWRWNMVKILVLMSFAGAFLNLLDNSIA